MAVRLLSQPLTTHLILHSYNEHLRLSERRLFFNVDELKIAAAKSINRPASDIKSIRKLAEGGFNRVFEIFVKTGSSVLARLPYPSALPRCLAVASEVATLALVRAHGIPAPRVLGYSIDEDAVGSEYILMEKVPGKPIGDTWFNLSEHERLKVLMQIVEMESKLFAVDLPASGSIYYARDLPANAPKVNLPGSGDGLCIGPYAAQRWWFGKRGDLDIDRGPHGDPRLVLQAPAEKELAWIRAYGRYRFPFNREYRETFGYEKQDPEEHAKSLKDYMRLAPHLVPSCPKLNRPVLRHPDLQPNKIFVNEDFEITGIIDWQHSLVLPTFLAAGMPDFFQNYGDEEPMSFASLQLPEDFESMDEDDRAIAQEAFRRRHTHFFYLGFTQRLNESHWHALEQDPDLLKRRMFNDAGNPWEGLNLSLQMDIVRITQNWSKIASSSLNGTIQPCPVVLEEQEAQRRATLDASLRDVDYDMEQIGKAIGIASDGWTSNNTFQGAKEAARSIREQGLDAVSDDSWLMEMTDRHWPFDDYDEDGE
jgi:aminoglycoside phosphotransferase (APT) family kinase protein